MSGKSHPNKGSEPKQPEPLDAAAKRDKWVAAVLIVLAVLLLLGAAAVVLYRQWVRKPTLPTADAQPTATLPPLESQPAQIEDDGAGVQPKVSGRRRSEDFFTILVFGEDKTSSLTDTIMVVSYDVTHQRAAVMSIPRDTLVNVRRSYKSINGVYSGSGKGEAGIAALKDEVSELVGFTPDFYVKIDWELVGKMVDAIGGVDFDIPYHMDYDDDYQDLHIHFDKGPVHLDGEDAMKVVRWRKNNSWSKYYGEGGGSDTARLAVQHQFLSAVLSQTLRIQNVTRIGELAELFGENVVSDLTINNLLWFGSQAIFGGLKVDDVNFVTMPYYGAPNENSPYFGRVCPDEEPLLALINESLNPYETEVTIKELDLMRFNSDGTLRSSTGVLADPSAGRP